jgi:hypothetical protein
MEINFFKTRTHNGSKNSGFEELVCQLSHLEKPNNGKMFVKKDGAGGDAGVANIIHTIISNVLGGSLIAFHSLLRMIWRQKNLFYGMKI